MARLLRHICFFGIFLILIQSELLPQTQETADFSHSTGDSLSTADPLNGLLSNRIIPELDFKEVAVRDALAALCRPYGVNIWVSPEVSGTITVYLTDVALSDVIRFIAKEKQLRWAIEDNILKIYPPSEAERFSYEIQFQDGQLSAEFDSLPLTLAVRALVDSTGRNMVIEQGVTGWLTGKLKNVPLEPALEALMSANGYLLTERDGIYYVDRPQETNSVRRAASYDVRCDSGLITLEVRQADLQRLVEDIVQKCNLPTVLYGSLAGTVTVKGIGVATDDLLTVVLRGTEYSFKKEDGVYQFGSAKMEEMRTSKFIALQHLVADDLLKLVPTAIAAKLAISVMPGQNGFLATGAYSTIKELEQFTESVDFAPAQILIEALVVDFSTSHLREFSIIANNRGQSQPGAGNESYYPEIQLYSAGKETDEKLQDLALRMGVTNIGHLSDDFYIRLRALSQEGKANIRSRPTIAALNGHEAAISIGTTQYYLLKTETVYNGGNANYTSQVSQRFETIKADVTLKVTPWVTAMQEIIVDIAPEFNTPQGQFDPEVPPTINHRTLHSRVRLRDGETIVLGGMIQTLENVVIDKFPLLGEIPILGRLFQNRRRSATEAELMIFLTPKIYYGSEGAVDISEYDKR